MTISEDTTNPLFAKKTKKRKDYPPKLLEKTLLVSKSIMENNAGRPYNRLDLAESVNMSPASSSFRQLITSSSAFGLTLGGYNAEKIALTELGISINSPKDEQEYKESLKKAIFNILFYKKIFTDFDQHNLPKKEFLLNTLFRDYKIPKEDLEVCYILLIKNADFLGFIKNIKNKNYINLENSVDQEVSNPEKIIPNDGDTIEEELEPILEENLLEPTDKIEKTKVFVAHSKNKKILNQIKQILELASLDYVVAEETTTTSIPIPEKVFGLMRNCNCAIVNVSVDNPNQESDSVEYKINSNVLIEIGAAFLAYDKRVILLVDDRIQLPSNLQGLFRCKYSGSELTFDVAMELSKSLKNFGSDLLKSVIKDN